MNLAHLRPQWSWPLLDTRRKRLLLLEVLAVVFLTLGRSGTYSALRLIEYYTRPEVDLSSQVTSMTSTYTPDRPWLDLTYHLVGFTFSLVPILLAGVLLYHSKDSIRSLWAGGRGWLEAKDLLRGLTIAAGVGGLGIVAYFVSFELGFATNVTAGGGTDAPTYYYGLLLLDALEAALIEEFLLLGYFLVRAGQLGLSLPKALVGVSALRGSYHLYQGPWGFVGNFFMGLAFGYLYARWGRVMPLVVAHFVMDAVAFVGLSLLASQGWDLPWS